MYQVKNFTDSKNVKKIAQLGGFSVIEYQRDLSVSPSSAVTAYYSAQMNVKKRQLVCNLSKAQVTVQAGAGIVADSVPEREYAESGNKARAVMEAMALASEVND